MHGEELLSEIARYAADKKAIDVVELDLRGHAPLHRLLPRLLAATPGASEGDPRWHLEGLKHEHELLPRRVEGSAQARLILMDYLDVVVHIFTPEHASSYRLEQLWGEVPARRPRGRQ